MGRYARNAQIMKRQKKYYSNLCKLDLAEIVYSGEFDLSPRDISVSKMYKAIEELGWEWDGLYWINSRNRKA